MTHINYAFFPKVYKRSGLYGKSTFSIGDESPNTSIWGRTFIAGAPRIERRNDGANLILTGRWERKY